ncbi:UNVERIFIED_CONTAM: Glyceraldehyde 3-phosphate phosphatase [Sesamum radiatum]|uniref:Glyceraldehyde 3-phosphate phosphatase n=1 Tax=Sesamum radiatum TaxID=300843 RepID=A0AAW2TVG2_SESRA
MEASTLFRAFKPFNFKLTASVPIRCSSIFSLPRIHTGKGGTLKRAYDGLLLDAGGTLLQLANPGDGKPFWKLVVSEATGCDNTNYFEEVYEYYANGDAWHLPEGAYETILCLKDSGVKLAVVSNFDSRLRKLLKDLNVLDLFDAVIISSEVGYEKPDGRIFRAALDQISVEASKAVHVGDDTKADKAGAHAVGIDCWLALHFYLYND